MWGWGSVVSPKAALAVAVAAVAAMGVLLAATAAPVAEAKKKTFSSGPINRPFTTYSGFADTIKIKKRGKIKGVDVAIRITHPDTTDLEIDIADRLFFGTILSQGWPGDGPSLSPDFGTGPGGCRGNVFTVFDDQAPTHISQGTNPFAGSYNPMEVTYPGGGAPPVLSGVPALAELKGRPLNQRFTLSSAPVLFGPADHPGVLHCWKMTVKYKPQKGKKQK